MNHIIENKLSVIEGGRAARQHYLVFSKSSIGYEEIAEVVKMPFSLSL